MIHKASKHQKRNRKIRDQTPSRADKIITVSCTCLRTPALGLGSMSACPCPPHQNALYLRDTVWKQRLLTGSPAGTGALPLPRRKATEVSRLLPFPRCCAVAQPCLYGWPLVWVSSGSVIDVFPSCRDCVSAVVAGPSASFHEAGRCVLRTTA